MPRTSECHTVHPARTCENLVAGSPFGGRLVRVVASAVAAIAREELLLVPARAAAGPLARAQVGVVRVPGTWTMPVEGADALSWTLTCDTLSTRVQETNSFNPYPRFSPEDQACLAHCPGS